MITLRNLKQTEFPIDEFCVSKEETNESSLKKTTHMYTHVFSVNVCENVGQILRVCTVRKALLIIALLKTNNRLIEKNREIKKFQLLSAR